MWSRLGFIFQDENDPVREGNTTDAEKTTSGWKERSIYILRGCPEVGAETIYSVY